VIRAGKIETVNDYRFGGKTALNNHGPQALENLIFGHSVLVKIHQHTVSYRFAFYFLGILQIFSADKLVKNVLVPGKHIMGVLDKGNVNDFFPLEQFVQGKLHQHRCFPHAAFRRDDSDFSRLKPAVNGLFQYPNGTALYQFA